MVNASCGPIGNSMKIRNKDKGLWSRSDSIKERGDIKGENSIRIESGESGPALKITAADITLQRRHGKVYHLHLSFKRENNHEGES